MSLLDGLAIRSVSYYKSFSGMSGGVEYVRLSVTGGEIVVTNPDEVRLIVSWMEQAEREHLNTENYVRYMLIENGIV